MDHFKFPFERSLWTGMRGGGLLASLLCFLLGCTVERAQSFCSVPSLGSTGCSSFILPKHPPLFCNQRIRLFWRRSGQENPAGLTGVGFCRAQLQFYQGKDIKVSAAPAMCNSENACSHPVASLVLSPEEHSSDCS